MIKEGRNRKKKKFDTFLIIALILVVTVLVLIFAYILSLVKEKEIELGKNVAEVTLNEDKSEANLKIENVNESVEKIRFVFVDDNNTEYNFETFSISDEFTISAEDAGLESFDDVVNVSAEFEFKQQPPPPEDNETEIEIEIPDECVPNCAGKQCGDDGCFDDCGSCAAGKKCESGACVDDICVNDSVSITCANNLCGMQKNNCQADVNCSNINKVACESCVPASKQETCGNWVCGDKINNCRQNVNCGTCTSGICINGKCEEIITLNCPRAKCYYVSTSGSDSNSGSESSPFRTIDRAESVAKENEGIIIRAGSYTIGDSIKPESGQYWKSYTGESVTINGKDDSFIFEIRTKKNIVVDGFILNEARYHIIYAFNSTNITIINNKVTDWNKANIAYRHGIMFMASVGGRIANNEVYSQPDSINNASGGIVMGGSHTYSLYTGGTLVENNYIHGNRIGNGIWADVRSGSPIYPGGLHTWRNNIVEGISGNGLRLETGSSAIIYNNIIINPGKSGLNFRACTNIDKTEVRNNVIYKPKSYGMLFDESPGPPDGNCTQNLYAKFTNLKVKNNIIYLDHSGAEPIRVEGYTSEEETNVFSNNLIYNTGSTEAICWNMPRERGILACPPTDQESDAVLYTTSTSSLNKFHTDVGRGCCTITGDPLFVDAASKDFHLKPGSPGCHAGDGGVNIGAYPDTGC